MKECEKAEGKWYPDVCLSIPKGLFTPCLQEGINIAVCDKKVFLGSNYNCYSIGMCSVYLSFDCYASYRRHNEAESAIKARERN